MTTTITYSTELAEYEISAECHNEQGDGDMGVITEVEDVTVRFLEGVVSANEIADLKECEDIRELLAEAYNNPYGA